MKTGKDGSATLLPKELEIFRQKTLFSVHVLPTCYGGYDKDDELCKNCSIATGDKILVDGIHAIADRINAEDVVCLRAREFGAPFFARHSGSCAERRKELGNAVLTLEVVNRMREERRAIKDIARLPKGEVREGKAPADYVKYYNREGLWVRPGKHSEKFPEAVGILYRYDGHDANPEHPNIHYFRSDRILGYIRNIVVEGKRFELSPGEEFFLIHPFSQQEYSDGNLILAALKPADKAENGRTLFIELYADSVEKVSARFDDIGRL